MDSRDIHGKSMFESKQIDVWISEICRETDHYYQAEIQQDQRASWLLATSSLLLTIIGGVEISLLQDCWEYAVQFSILEIIFLTLSCFFSILTMLPLKGISLSKDFWGKEYRHVKNLSANEILSKQFRITDNWSEEDLENRINNHYRSHYLRNILKSYGVIITTIFLLLGILTFAIEMIVFIL